MKRTIFLCVLAAGMVLMQISMTAIFAEERTDLESDLKYYFNFSGTDYLRGSGLSGGELEAIDDIEQKNEAPLSVEAGDYALFEKDGINYLQAEDGILEGFKDELTVSVWINPANIREWTRIFDFGQGNMFLSVTLWPEGNGGRASALFTLNGSEEMVNLWQEAQTLQLNKWHLITLTVKDKIMTLYVDGAVNVSGEIPSDLSVFEESTENMFGKSRYAHDPLFEGSMDEIRIYSRALNISEIEALASGKLDAPERTQTETKEPDETKTPDSTASPSVTSPASKNSAAKTNTPGMSENKTQVPEDSGRGEPGWILFAAGGAILAIGAAVAAAAVIRKNSKRIK